ncbi:MULTISPECIES: hypothetical protein [unclassified Sphingomonas]|uniref:hypothetical protein n=1 Tax=unclassified Sphingomonas TaxID=196159 RepID=UPI00226A658E|nr:MULTISPECIES: hypothetical protein [unclassified Sphingomonas]
MSKNKYEGTVGARATITLELSGLGSWGTPYTMEQIIDQATEAAEGTIRQAFRGEQVRITNIDVTAVYAPAKKARP